MFKTGASPLSDQDHKPEDEDKDSDVVEDRESEEPEQGDSVVQATDTGSCDASSEGDWRSQLNDALTKVAGCIAWSRQLLRRITIPMERFKENPEVFHPKEAHRVIVKFNSLSKKLIHCEMSYSRRGPRAATWRSRSCARRSSSSTRARESCTRT